jgi:hypothetical protein
MAITRTSGRGKKGRVSCRARRGDRGGNLTASPRIFISPTRRVHGPGQTNPKPMAWRPYSNLMAGELDNRIPGKVTGWMRFFRNGKPPLQVTFDLVGDFHEDIRGKVIRLSNPKPSDEYQDEGKTYMDGFNRVQLGTVGDITAGLPLGPWSEALARKLMERNELFWDKAGIQGTERERQKREFSERYRAHIAAGDFYYPYVEYPYIEWYAANGRVVLELDPSQVEIVGSDASPKEKTTAELLEADNKRDKAFLSFLEGMANDFSRQNRDEGGDGNVTGIVV